MDNLIQIILRPLFHRGQQCIGIFFERNTAIQNSIQKSAGAKWSRTKRCWWIPCKRENYLLLKETIRDKASIEDRELKRFVSKEREISSAQSSTMKRKNIGKIKQRKDVQIPSGDAPQHLCPPTLSKENRAAFEQFSRQLILKGYSPSTIRTYTNEFMQFLNSIKNVPARSFTAERLKDYLQYCHVKLKLSENTLHSKINALKFYFEQVLGREKFFWKIPRPKKPMLLPKLLNEKEIRKLFNSLTNKKHKAMLFTAYSAGLRVSEIVNLKISDIDSDRMQIFIERAKGKKDRYVNLSPILLDILRNYLLEYRPKPKIYLFESEQTLTAYPTRTVQQIFANAKRKAGIKKDVGIHSLRHSFATHLLDKGTDIRYIKDLLGHFNIRTTERYLHVSKERLINIVSPFDDLWNKEGVEW